MTIFLSQRPNLDPEPWIDELRGHKRVQGYHTDVFGPREEYTQTNDPHPWEVVIMATDTVRERLADPSWATFWDAETEVCEWAPRHEDFDTPVNRILTAFRRSGKDASVYLAWLGRINEAGYILAGWSVAEREHAVKVLTRLAAL